MVGNGPQTVSSNSLFPPWLAVRVSDGFEPLALPAVHYKHLSAEDVADVKQAMAGRYSALNPFKRLCKPDG